MNTPLPIWKQCIAGLLLAVATWQILITPAVIADDPWHEIARHLFHTALLILLRIDLYQQHARRASPLGAQQARKSV